MSEQGTWKRVQGPFEAATRDHTDDSGNLIWTWTRGARFMFANKYFAGENGIASEWKRLKVVGGPWVPRISEKILSEDFGFDEQAIRLHHAPRAPWNRTVGPYQVQITDARNGKVLEKLPVESSDNAASLLGKLRSRMTLSPYKGMRVGDLILVAPFSNHSDLDEAVKWAGEEWDWCTSFFRLYGHYGGVWRMHPLVLLPSPQINNKYLNLRVRDLEQKNRIVYVWEGITFGEFKESITCWYPDVDQAKMVFSVHYGGSYVDITNGFELRGRMEERNVVASASGDCDNNLFMVPMLSACAKQMWPKRKAVSWSEYEQLQPAIIMRLAHNTT